MAITASPEESAQANPPRALHPRGARPGRSLLEPNDRELHERILRDALELVARATEPGRIVTKAY